MGGLKSSYEIVLSDVDDFLTMILMFLRFFKMILTTIFVIVYFFFKCFSNCAFRHHKCKQAHADIFLGLPQDRTSHKVYDPKVYHSGDFEEGMSGTSQGSIPARLCWSSEPLSAMWAWWAKLDIDSNLGPGMYAWS